MSIDVGDGHDTQGVVVAEPRPSPGEWSTRVLAAVGGAVVVICLMVLGAGWTTGLRGSTVEELRSDIATGSVSQWYAASVLERGPTEFVRARQAGESGGPGLPQSEDANVAPQGFPDGGLLVWRTHGQTGWSVAVPGGVVNAVMSAPATEASTALVRELREAEVPMKPFEFSDDTALDWVFRGGGVALLAWLVFGPTTRVGTKWFWFWLLMALPGGLAAIPYAVTELIGLRRRPDPPLDRRLKGVVGFAAGILVSIGLGLVATFLRSRGVLVPL